MVQTEAMAAISKCVVSLEKVSNILFEAGAEEASQIWHKEQLMLHMKSGCVCRHHRHLKKSDGFK